MKPNETHPTGAAPHRCGTTDVCERCESARLDADRQANQFKAQKALARQLKQALSIPYESALREAIHVLP